MRDRDDGGVTDELWPVTIVQTRYGGVYEGADFNDEGDAIRLYGRWAAFNCHPEDVPAEAFGGDPIAAGWWADIRRDGSMAHPRERATRLHVGVGLTPDAALAALQASMGGSGA